MPKGFRVSDCNIVELPGTYDPGGTVVSLENGNGIPFDILRAYYLYDIPGGANRGAHAHKDLQQLVVALSGSFDIILDDGLETKTVRLDSSRVALHLKPGIWRELSNFSSGAICLSLASRKYSESDYIREYEDFKALYGTLESKL